jgi:hypothetical protein
MAAMGHEEKALALVLSARIRLSERTFSGPHDNGQKAPRAPIRSQGIKPSASIY